MTADLDIRVECYAGHRGEEEPRRFWIGTRAITVEEIIDRWLAPDHRYFKVRGETASRPSMACGPRLDPIGDDGGTYILRHETHGDRWELTLYERGR